MRYGEEYETLLPSERFHSAMGRGDSADELAFDVLDTVMSFRESLAFMRRKSDILKKAVAEGDFATLDYFERHFGTDVSRLRAEIERNAEKSGMSLNADRFAIRGVSAQNGTNLDRFESCRRLALARDGRRHTESVEIPRMPKASALRSTPRVCERRRK